MNKFIDDFFDDSKYLKTKAFIILSLFVLQSSLEKIWN